MKKLLVFLPLLALTINTPTPTYASGLSYNKKLELCTIYAQANSMGVSGTAMLRHSLEQKGQPGYLANVFYDEIKSVCPRVY